MGGFGSGPYQLECWSEKGGKRWSGVWTGTPETGCYAWDGATVWVVINGIRSNTLKWQTHTEPPTTAEPAPTYTTISAGGSHSCAIQTDQTVVCWGYNWSGEADGPEDKYKYTTIAAGDQHSCAIRTNGTATCWGDNTLGQTDAPPGKFTTITAGGQHSCAIRTNGTATCWGDNEDGQTNAPAGTFSAITAGHGHSCAIRTNGTATCWGRNEDGQTNAPSGKYTTITAGIGSFVRHPNQRHRHLLGPERRRTDQRAIRQIHHHHSRIGSFVRHPNQRHRHLLGPERRRTDQRAIRHLFSHHSQPRSFVRHPNQRHRHLLGRQRRRADQRAIRHLFSHHSRRGAFVRHPKRRCRCLLGRVRESAPGGLIRAVRMGDEQVGGGRVAFFRDVDRCSGREGVISRWCENVEADARWTLGAVVDGRRPYLIGLVKIGASLCGWGKSGTSGSGGRSGLGHGRGLGGVGGDDRSRLCVRLAGAGRDRRAGGRPRPRSQWSVLAAEVKRIRWWVASASGTARPYTTRRWRSAPTG